VIAVTLPTKLWSDLQFTPHADQLTCYQDLAPAIHREVGTCRFFDYCTGRQWGKTTLARAIVIEGSLLPDDEFGPPCVKVIADTYEHTNLIWDGVVAAFMGIPRLKKLLQSYDKERGLITLTTGATIQRLSADRPQGLTGFTITLAVLDEAAFISDESMQMLLPCLAVRQGVAVAFGTAEGVGWHRDWWFMGQDPEYPNHKSRSFPSTSNPYFPPEELRVQQALLPIKRFRQLYLAEWQSEEGAVFHNVEGCIVPYPQFPVPPDPARFYMVGSDVAKTGDYTVATVMDVATHRVVAWDRFHERDWYVQAARIAEWSRKYGNAPIINDSTGMGDVVSAILRREQGRTVHDFVFSNQTKDALVSRLVVGIEREDVKFPDIPQLKRELMFFESRRTPSGRMTYSAPGNQHDDCVISLALAYWGCTKLYTPPTEPPTRQVGYWEYL